MKDKNCIGGTLLTTEDIKDEYRTDSKSTMVYVYLDKIDIKFRVVASEMAIKEMVTELKKSKKIDKLDFNKELDTSTWVHPDRDSLKNELATVIINMLILKNDSDEYKTMKIKHDILYSILYSKAPKNPQSLTIYSTFDDMSTLFQVIGDKEKSMVLWDYIKIHSDKSIEPKYNREEYNKFKDAWHSKMLKKMLIE